MATTTNYGWTTPDDTALVKDGASAIRTLGSSVDTTTKNLNPETTLADIAYRSSTSNVNTRLGIGSTGQVLTVAGGVPTWATPAGGGKVLQVVQGTLTGPISSSTSTFVDTGLTVNITPSSATSKVLIFAALNSCEKRTNDTSIAFKLLRGATQVTRSGGNGYNGAVTRIDVGSCLLNFLDTPATTSATTYKVQFMSEGNNAIVVLNQDATGANDTVSTIIAMEIGA